MRLAATAILSALILLPASAFAQRALASSPTFRESAPGLPDSQPMRSLPTDAYNEPPDFGVPTRSLFRNTRTFPIPNTNALAPAPHVETESVHGMFKLEMPSLNGNFPLLERGFAPQNADLKFGPVYFKLNALSAALLFSDNINLTENNRDSGVISILRLSGTLVVQLTEDLHLSAAGSIIYLPLQGEVGFGGTASRIPYSLGLTAIPALRSQFTWDTVLAGVPVLIADDFRTRIGYYSFSTRDDFTNFEPTSAGGEDRAGRYAFRLPSHSQSTRDNGNRTVDEASDFLVFSNEVSASTERILPGDIRLHVRVFNENLWYNQGRRGLPTLRDGASVLLQEMHEDWRFKPFLSYDVLYTSVSQAFNHTILLGITGPITDQLDLRAAAGAFYYSRNGSTHFLFHLDLRHVAGPYTRETLFVGRTVNDFQDELTTEATYTLHQVLGPKLTGSLFGSYAKVEDLLGEYRTRDEIRTGLRLQYEIGPKTSLEASGIYRHVTNDPFIDGNTDTWTARLDLQYRFTDSLYSRLLYQYQLRDANVPNRSYYENLIYLSLTKYFH